MAGPGSQLAAAAAPSVVRRKREAITTNEIIGIVKGIPELSAKLDTVVRDKTVRARIEESLRSYKAHMATKKDEDVDIRDAMMLSTALGNVARVFAADVLNDPSAATVLMPKMLEVFENEVGRKLKSKWALRRSKTSHAKVMSLTKALSGGDPVTQYMHRELRKDVAAEQIRSMAAADSSLAPLKVFELMSERWQAAMGTYDKAQLRSLVKDPVGDFNRAETHGEYSNEFFKRTFGTENPEWEDGGAGQADQLKLTQDARKMLDDLRAEVQNPTAQQQVAARPGLNEKQERHLAGLEAAEKAGPETSDAEFIKFLAERYTLTAAAATALLADVKRFMRQDVKLTVTVDLESWFGTQAAPKTPNAEFKPANAAGKSTNLADVFAKAGAQGAINHLPTWKDRGDASDRGASYLRFRHWKDQLMTGLQDFSGSDMAAFGSANLTWDTALGSDKKENHGTNYYGNLHFVVDRAKVADRMIYTATDHGEPRRDPYLALLDACREGNRGRTWLREITNFNMIDNVVNAVRAKAPMYGLGLTLEWQAFGGLDILEDVTEVLVGPSLPADAVQRVTDFYQAKGTTVTQVGAAPPDAFNGGEGNLNEGVPAFIRALVAHGDQLDDGDKAKVSRYRQGGGGYVREILIGAYAMARSAHALADKLAGTMEPGDAGVLDTMITKAKSMQVPVNGDKDIKKEYKAELAAAIKAAELAVDAAKAAPSKAPQQPADGKGQSPQKVPDPTGGDVSPTGAKPQKPERRPLKRTDRVRPGASRPQADTAVV